jgi:hypothetical protein
MPDIYSNMVCPAVFTHQKWNRTRPDKTERIIISMKTDYLQKLAAKPDKPDMPGHPDIVRGTPPGQTSPPPLRGGVLSGACPVGGVPRGTEEREPR